METAASEGFAHFYAARVMNDYVTGRDARFTYYKDYLVKYPVGQDESVPPPYPISIGTPYTFYSATGWTRTWCGQTSKSSEYDWLTSLWAVNGVAASNARSTMNDLFATLRNSTPNFTWVNIGHQANLHFGSSNNRRATWLNEQLNVYGLDL